MTQRRLAILTSILLLFCYAATLRGMVEQWAIDDDMSHGFLVPVVIAWIVWQSRNKWATTAMEPSSWGWVLLALGFAFHFAGAVGGGLFSESVGFVLSIAGAVVALGGFAWLRLWAFPLFLTLFMLPKLAIAYNQLTLPLQLLASKMAAKILTVAGATVIRDGNILDVGGHKVAVEEACNGIRFLLPLVFLAFVFAYVSRSRWWTGATLALFAVPVAIVANAMRVAAAGYWPKLTDGVPHEALGVAIFIFCLLTFVPLQRVVESWRPHA
jgi:exosortase